MECPLIKREIDESICLCKCKIRSKCLDAKLGESAVYAIAVRNPRISIKYTINVLEKHKLAEKTFFVKVSGNDTDQYMHILETDLIGKIRAGELPNADKLDIYECGSRIILETTMEYKLKKVKDGQ